MAVEICELRRVRWSGELTSYRTLGNLIRQLYCSASDKMNSWCIHIGCQPQSIMFIVAELTRGIMGTGRGPKWGQSAFKILAQASNVAYRVTSPFCAHSKLAKLSISSRAGSFKISKDNQTIGSWGRAPELYQPFRHHLGSWESCKFSSALRT